MVLLCELVVGSRRDSFVQLAAYELVYPVTGLQRAVNIALYVLKTLKPSISLKLTDARDAGQSYVTRATQPKPSPAMD